MVRDFLAAVNKESKILLAPCLTPKLAESLSKLSSLREAVSGSAGTQRVDLLYVTFFGAVQQQRYVDLMVRFIDLKGGSQPRKARLQVTPTASGWKIGPA